MMLLSLMILPLAFAIVISMAKPERAYQIAVGGTVLTFLWAIRVMGIFNWGPLSGEFQMTEEVPWLPSLGLSLSVGVDSVAMLLIGLTALLGPICVLASKTAIKDNTRTYYSWLLVLQAAMTGVFASRDLVLFYICFEFTLVPMFVLISLYGSTNRKKAAIKFFLYTFTGSVIALAGLVYVAFAHAAKQGSWTFDIATLEATARTLPASTQAWVLLALLCGFAVKVPLFPVHTWLPLAHTEAPTAGSVILAGVLLKLGTYAIFRFVLPFTPLAVAEYAPVLGVFCIIGILYGGLICWVQTDVKKLVAYSSVAHLGFCMLGMFALNRTGLQGSILYMINHGLSTGALFLLIGMIYERYHTRNMKELGGLAAKMPVWATFMVFFAMASVGLPGLNGFVSEFLCLAGTFQASSAWGTHLWGSSGGFMGGQVPGATAGSLGPWYAAVAGVGMIVAAMYLLYMVGKVVWGPLVEPHGHGHGHDHAHAHDEPSKRGAHTHDDPLSTDLNIREIGTLIPLAIACLWLGIYPKPTMDALDGPIARTVGIVENARSAPVLTPDRAHADASPSHGDSELNGRTSR